MTTTAPTTRAARAASALARLRAAEAGAPRAHAYQYWQAIATDAELRRHWRAWMGPRPGWLKA
jgi:hypothetical protein